MRIAVDTGGTFTDCVTHDGAEIKILKVFSTPDDAAQGIFQGVRQLAGESRPSDAVDIVHGTTVGTNTLLERCGARVALVTTKGFEDLIEIGRQNRPHLYDLNVQRHPPLVPRNLRWGMRARVDASGKILVRPSASELKHIVRKIQASGAEAAAVCFLFSFRNPRHERLVAQAVRAAGIPISVSHEILPEFREYERLSTVVINAYLLPRLGSYLANLAREAIAMNLHFPGASALGTSRTKQREMPGARDFSAGRIYVMQSNGGITTAERAAREPVRTILSGPAGGVVATARLAERLGIRRVISFDMGGTSTDVCLLDGPPRTTHETTLADLPVAVPVLDVHSVGAGGGSLARVDAGGALRAGPESAGAVPGPICYGRGGTRPTVSDAHLLLGRLDPDHFLGGALKLDAQRVEDCFAQFLREPPRNLRASFPASPVELARGIVSVSNATMERALRVISVERGHDPRDFTLVCFGGAGGLHAADLARSLRLAGVIVPRHPGAFSALGILLSDIVKDVSQSVLLAVPEHKAGGDKTRSSLHFRSFLEQLRHRFDAIERRALAELRREHFNLTGLTVERGLAVRYVGQAYELFVPFTPDFRDHFHSEHEKSYGHSQPGRTLEIVSLRVRLALPTSQPRTQPTKPRRPRSIRQAIIGRKPVWFEDRFWKTALYDRECLDAGAHFAGPAIVVEYSSTTVVPPDFACSTDHDLNLRLAQHAH